MLVNNVGVLQVEEPMTVSAGFSVLLFTNNQKMLLLFCSCSTSCLVSFPKNMIGPDDTPFPTKQAQYTLSTMGFIFHSLSIVLHWLCLNF